MTIQEAFEKVFLRAPTQAELEDPYFLAELRRACPEMEFTAIQQKASKVLAAFPQIIKDGTVYFGGDQGWFARKTQRLAACGPVAAANILACLAAQKPMLAKHLPLGFEPEKQIEQQNYLAFMQSVYDTIGTFEVPIWNAIAEKSDRTQFVIPPSFGREAAGFESGMLRYAKKYGVLLQAHRFINAYGGYRQGLYFIQKGLAAGCPVALLSTKSKHPMQVYAKGYGGPLTAVNNGVGSHFATIVGLRRNASNRKMELLASSWGKLCVIDYASLYNSWQSPLAVGSQMAYFTTTRDTELTKRQIITAYTAVPKSLVKSVAGLLTQQVHKRR